jgi:hypothetical protein
MANTAPEISEYAVSFTPDAEWLMLQTAPFVGQSVLHMAPAENDLVNMDVPGSEGLYRVHSEAGSFEMSAPENRPFDDWALALHGLPRIIDKLNEDTIKDLFGAKSIPLIHQALEITQNGEVTGTFGTITSPHRNLYAQTGLNRMQYTRGWHFVKDKRYIVPRSDIIKD